MTDNERLVPSGRVGEGEGFVVSCCRKGARMRPMTDD